MKQRCYNLNHKDYKYYGGRGIKVYSKWKNSFSEFYKYIGPRPSAKYSLDRIDNNGNYEPGNVQWATRTRQVRNRRKLRIASSRYKGVDFHMNKYWRSRIQINHKLISLGCFPNEISAAMAYDEICWKNFKDLGLLNFPKNYK